MTTIRNKIVDNTILGMGLFRDEIRNSVIFHIPHASNIIPDLNTGFDISKIALINQDNIKSTDWNTDEIFDIEGIDSVVYPYSRLYCDVERHIDEFEDNYKIGRGFFYTKTSDGIIIREEDDIFKDYIYRNEYLKHHELLTKKVQTKLDKYNSALIIDCHSFSFNQLNKDRNTVTPDICIGTDEFHTPDYLLSLVKNTFERLGFTVEINSPYSGTMVPGLFLNKDNRVKSIMIEINKDLYLNDKEEISYLNNVIDNMLSF